MKTTFLLAILSAALLANATGAFSIIEINPAHGTEQFVWSDSSKHIYGAGEMSNITELNGTLYFYAQDGLGNEELWKTDGTSQGTELVKDINPSGSSMIGNIMTVGNRLLFIATDNNNWDFDLFASDGTDAGTIKLMELNQGWNDALAPQRAAAFGNTILFCTNTDLMSTDGTVSGTKSLLTLSQYYPSQGYCELNGFAYFILNDQFGKPQLWKTDGTTQGTQLALDISASPNNIISVEKLLAFNNRLYMVAASSGQGSDLFEFDGSSQLQRIQLVTGGNAYPHSISVIDNHLVFVASNMTGTNLYIMKTTDPAPQLVSSVSSINISSGLSFANGSVYFLGDNQFDIHSVELNTLSHHVLSLTHHTIPYYFFTDDKMLTGAGGKIFFAAYDTATGKQVFMESNGSPEETFVAMPSSVNTMHPFNILLSCGAADIFDFKMFGNKVIVPANFNDAGRELWIYEPQGLTNGIKPADNKPEVQLFPNPTSSELNFRIGNAGYCETNVQVTNMKGELMLQRKVVGETSSVDVSTLAPGNYCISFSSLQEGTTIKKFVVVK